MWCGGVGLLDGQIVRRGDSGRLERRFDIFARVWVGWASIMFDVGNMSAT